MNKKEQKLLEISKENALKFFVLYTYDLKKQPKSKAVRFVYLLKGRKGEKGLINNFRGKFLAPGCFILPFKKDREMKEVFSLWKVPHKKMLLLTD